MVVLDLWSFRCFVRSRSRCGCERGHRCFFCDLRSNWYFGLPAMRACSMPIARRYKSKKTLANKTSTSAQKFLLLPTKHPKNGMRSLHTPDHRPLTDPIPSATSSNDRPDNEENSSIKKHTKQENDRYGKRNKLSRMLWPKANLCLKPSKGN